MSIDVLQDKIRKTKTPVMVTLEPLVSKLPPQIRDLEESDARKCGIFCRTMINGLKDQIPAVKVSYACFALAGAAGLRELEETVRFAADAGLYVLLDWGRADASPVADAAARAVFDLGVDGVTLNPYLGTDAVKPYLPFCKEKKSLFIQVRTPNRSAAELQELLSGGRLTYVAAADLVNRWGSGTAGKFAYAQVAAQAAANSPDALRTLRSKYPEMFLLVDGYDAVGGNAKNASLAFDRLGRGAAVCAGSSVTGAWAESENADYVAAAQEAVERIKRALGRYITVL